MAGRPGWVSAVEDEEGTLADVADLARAWASAMVASARWMVCWRVEVLDWRVEWRVFRAVISPWRVVMAAWREWDWERRDCAAESDCAA